MSGEAEGREWPAWQPVHWPMPTRREREFLELKELGGVPMTAEQDAAFTRWMREAARNPREFEG